MRRTLLLELLDDCIFSETAATEGAHETLDRVPGSALLGAAAARLYPTLGPQEAFDAFHGGRLRFGDGLPEATPGRPAWPMPLCWHRRKAGSVFSADGQFLDPGELFNFLHCDAIRDGIHEAQAKQMRDGYVTEDGRWLRPRRNFRLKTAISSNSNRAEEARLFGYAALERGQRFVAALDADPDFDTMLFERVVDSLSGIVFLGRSRAAEYGRTRVQILPEGSVASSAPAASGNTLTLWLLSDLACCNALGEPTTVFDPIGLGLPEGSRVIWGKTFVRSRSYSPWNAARHGFDTERRVLRAGGVICIDLPPQADATLIATRIRSGIGLHRECGLGRVWVDPPLLASEHPAFVEARPATRSPCYGEPQHPLLDWLKPQDGSRKEAIERRAREIADRYRERIETARRAHGFAETAHDFHPSRSHWATVLEAARNANGTKLYQVLFEGQGAVAKATAKGWSLELPAVQDGKPWVPLTDWLRGELTSNGRPDAVEALLVRQLARLLMDAPTPRRR